VEGGRLTYLTDGWTLFEVVDRTIRPNFGRAGGCLSEALLRDCYNERLVAVTDAFFRTLREVRP
jgi:hypothetical protein